MNWQNAPLKFARFTFRLQISVRTARTLLCLLAGLLVIGGVTPSVTARSVNIIDPQIMPVQKTSEAARDELVANWEAFPLVDYRKEVEPDDGDVVITQDGRTCTDGWQRLIINDKPVMIKGERYSGFRFVTRMGNARDLYFGVRELKSAAQWNIVFKDEPMEGFDKSYKLRTQPSYDVKFYANYLSGKFLKDDKEYLIYFKLKSKLPEELAFRYKFVNPSSLPNLPISQGRQITFTILHLFPESAEPRTRLGIGMVLTPEDVDEKKSSVIAGLIPGGPAEKAGLKVGDQLLDVGGRYGKSMDNKSLREEEISEDPAVYRKARDAAKPGERIPDDLPKEMSITVQREGTAEPLTFKVMTAQIEIAGLRSIKKELRAAKFERVGGPADEMYAQAMKLLAEPANATNREEAFTLLQKSSRKMFYPAMTQLAILYGKGEGTPENQEKSLEILLYLDSRRGGPQDKDTIRYLLGRHYEEGKGTPVDYQKAVYYFRQSRSSMHLAGTMRLAEITLSDKLPAPDGSNPNAALSIFLQASQWGEPEGAYRAGQVAAEMRDRNRQSDAVRYYRLAIAKDHSGAMVELGKFYELGIGGLEKDYAQAVSWYEKAWALKNIEAAQRLGLMLSAGKGIERDATKARELLIHAKEHGVVAITDPYIFPARPARTRSTKRPSTSTPPTR